MNILHIHQDYPDGRPYPYTKAVSNLIASCELEAADIQHTVVSVNRTSNPFKLSAEPFEQGLSLIYWAIPLPFIYALSMKLSALYIHNKIKLYKFDLIHGHKLTSEGVLTYFLAKKANKPYVLSIRGGSDMHNVKRLPVHKGLFQKILNTAQHIFWVSAWAKKPIQESLNITSEKMLSGSLLPNICNINLTFLQQPHSTRYGFVTAVSYHQYKRKGVVELIEAIALLNKTNPEIILTIYGTGDDVYKSEIVNIIQKFSAEECVQLKGQVSQSTLLEAMSLSKGFLLPAENETFGMAYIEALSVGCPILYVENTGVDGYFNNIDVGEKLSELNVAALTDSINKMNTNNALLCENLKRGQNERFLSCYNSHQVAINYLNDLNNNIKQADHD